MRSTGGESLEFSLSRRDFHHSRDDEDIGCHDTSCRYHKDQPHRSQNYELIETGVRTGEGEERADITEEMVDDVVRAEVQTGEHEGVQEGIQSGEDPRHSHQRGTKAPSHNGGVMQRVTNGHITVIRHHCEKEVVHVGKHHTEIHLSQAARVGDGLSLCLDVQQHLGDSR